jgi:HlyD family secretion protein
LVKSKTFTRGKTMRNRKLILLVGFVLVGAAFSFKLIVAYSKKNPNIIRVSGNIEVTEVAESFKIPGRVEVRLVDEGEIVKAGQVIARLDKVDLSQEVAQRAAEAQAAQAALAELLSGSRPEEIREAAAAERQSQARLEELLAGSRSQEVAAAQAALARGTAETERARADYKRYEGLYKKEIVSAQQNDSVRTAYETAQARQREAEEQLKLVQEGPRKEQIEQARAAWRQAEEHYALVKEGPRRETIDQARARLEQAKQVLAQAETHFSYATVVSPLSGVVLSKNIEAGEYVAAGTPVVTVGDLESVWVRAYINETDLGRVKVGQKVRVTTDTYQGRVYDGRVSFIASEAEFTPKNVQTEKERVKLVYRVKVDIQSPNMELKPGMPVDADILTAKGGD